MVIESSLCIEIRREELEETLIGLANALADEGHLETKYRPWYPVKDLDDFAMAFPECSRGMTRDNISMMNEKYSCSFNHFLFQTRIQSPRAHSAGRIIITYTFEPGQDIGCLRVEANDNNEDVPHSILAGVCSAAEKYANTKRLKILD